MTVHRRARRPALLLAAGVVAAALAAPPALARPIDSWNEPVPLDRGATAVEPARPPADAPVVVRRVAAGFDWGSAAVGAGGAGALVVLVSLGGFAYASRDRVPVAR
jgi:hypothetical protein